MSTEVKMTCKHCHTELPVGHKGVCPKCGRAAGQTIFHCHVHLIPRRKGDTANPRGGVRGVIPDRMSY